MANNKVLVLIHQNLRVQDNPLLTKAAEISNNVRVLHVLDDFWDKGTQFGIPRLSEKRRAYLYQNLQILQQSLYPYHINLHAHIGDGAEILAQMIEEEGITHLLYPKEIAPEELHLQEAYLNKVQNKVQLLEIEDGFLISLQDQCCLPQNTPNIFSDYRKKLEKHLQEYPEYKLEPLNNPDFKPEFDGLHWSMDGAELAFVLPPGENAAWARLDEYWWKSERVANYKNTRNRMLGDFSTRMSAYLAMGNISARELLRQTNKFEQEVQKNSSTYWVKFELIWREFFRMTMLKQGSKMFYPKGFNKAEHPNLNLYYPAFEQWCAGTTGQDLVDANMRELAETGWMCNRGRQIVASYLINDLGVDYRLGAAYFEYKLLDYDVCSNQGNWLYLSGYGNDPRGRRAFNLDFQQKKYDPNDAYVNTWNPSLV